MKRKRGLRNKTGSSDPHVWVRASCTEQSSLGWDVTLLARGDHSLLREAMGAPGGVQGQVGWGPGQLNLVLELVVGSPACGGGVGA